MTTTMTEFSDAYKAWSDNRDALSSTEDEAWKISDRDAVYLLRDAFNLLEVILATMGLVDPDDAFDMPDELFNPPVPLKRWRLTGNYGTFVVERVVEAATEADAFELTGIAYSLTTAGWTMVESPDGEEWTITELTDGPSNS